MSNNTDDREGQSTRGTHILEKCGHNEDHEDSNMFNVDENDDISTTANITENNNEHNVDNYHNVDVDDSNVYNVEGYEDINTCLNSEIGNKNDNQNKPKIRNGTGDKRRQDRNRKERNRIRGQQRAMGNK